MAKKKMKNQVGDPLDFGALYDGITDCTLAINECIQKHDHIIFRGSGIALVSNSLVIRSGVWLDFDPGFTIKLASGSNCVLLKNKWAESAYFAAKNGTPEFMSELYPPVFEHGDWIMGESEKNIKITGGIFDGNGVNQQRQDWRYGSMGYYGVLLLFVNIDGLELSNVKMKNAVTYNAQFDMVRNFRITNINMTYDIARPNIDGLHFGGGCCYGVIDGVTGKTYDDMVALNGGDSWRPKATNGNAILSQADKVWYPFAQGKIFNIEIRSIMADDGYRAVRLLSNVKVPSSPEDETEGMDNIVIDGIYGSYKVNAVLISSHIGNLKKYGNITIRNIRNTQTFPARMSNIRAEPLTYVDNLIISDYHHKTDAFPVPLELLGGIENLIMRDVLIDVSDAVDLKGRAAVEIGSAESSCRRLFFDNISINASGSSRYSAAFALTNVVKIKVSNSSFDCDAFIQVKGENTYELHEMNNDFKKKA
ncbi:MAG: hypothetical protein A2017_16060 [Lentisphaerae bacterium GWF2_44_16]|nr:MAG: hypothetical protein A2017_16060 [Lentisphaerae bacterium GWF2_44_16]